VNANRGDFEIVSFNVSEKTGTRKRPVPRVEFVAGAGISGDAHAGLLDDRQVSLLAAEEIEAASEAARAAGGRLPEGRRFGPGDFAENVTTRGVVLHELPIGTKIEIGDALLEISKIGKECHAACEIRRLTGDCVMPRRGVFARVLESGEAGREDRGHYRF